MNASLIFWPLETTSLLLVYYIWNYFYVILRNIILYTIQNFKSIRQRLLFQGPFLYNLPPFFLFPKPVTTTSNIFILFFSRCTASEYGKVSYTPKIHFWLMKCLFLSDRFINNLDIYLTLQICTSLYNALSAVLKKRRIKFKTFKYFYI